MKGDMGSPLGRKSPTSDSPNHNQSFSNKLPGEEAIPDFADKCKKKCAEIRKKAFYHDKKRKHWDYRQKQL
jgi:hypothetical protein